MWPRDWAAYGKHVSKSVRTEYRMGVTEELEAVVHAAIGLQNARAYMRSVRALRNEPTPESKYKQRQWRDNIKSQCSQIHAILEDIGRTVPDEFRVD